MLKPDRFVTGAALRRWSPAAFVLAAAAACAPAHAVDVTETGDAGQALGTAQITTGNLGSLNNVFGVLDSPTDADLYLIEITNAAAFSASTFNAGSDDVDTQLFLFTLAGAPVYANDDDAGGTTLLSTLPGGSSLGPVAAGRYYLGISMSGYDPVNASNQLLFASGLSTDTRGPAFGLQPDSLGGFDGAGFDPAGAYAINLTGAAVAAVPEPASALMLLLGVAGVGAARLGRRRNAAQAGV